MVDWFAVILVGISFIAFAISAGFLTDATRRIATISGYSENAKLSNAHRLGVIGSVVAWISVALLLTGLVLLIFFSPEEAEATEAEAAVSKFSFANILVYGVLFFILAGVITVGILAAIMANDIRTSGITDTKSSETQSIISASIAIGVFVAIVIALIVEFTHKPKAKNTNTSIISQLERNENFTEF